MRIFILLLLMLGLSACSGGGFSASVKNPESLKANAENRMQVEAIGSDIVLAGGLVLSDGESLKVPGQITAPGAVLRQSTDFSALKDIGSRNDYILIGCPASLTSLKDLTAGLTERKINLEESGSQLELKARLVIFCGQVSLTQSFVSAVADQIVLIDFKLESSGKEETGFFALAAKKLNLVGRNQISSRESKSSKGVSAQAPSLFLMSEGPLDGNGTLSLKVER